MFMPLGLRKPNDTLHVFEDCSRTCNGGFWDDLRIIIFLEWTNLTAKYAVVPSLIKKRTLLNGKSRNGDGYFLRIIQYWYFKLCNSEEEQQHRPLEKKALLISGGTKNPVMMLNELRPGLRFDCSEANDLHTTKRFVMKVRVEDDVFEGSGASKKQAKQACARAALTKLYNVSFTPHISLKNSQNGSCALEENVANEDFVPGKMHFSNDISCNFFFKYLPG